MHANETPAILAKGLTKHFGDTIAIDDLELRLEPGEVLGFLGPNGAGKTTTVKLLLGLLKPSAGEVRIFGKRVEFGARGALGRVSGVVDAPAFYPFMSGRDNLKAMALMGDIVKDRIDPVLEEVGLDDARRTKFGDYSTGMKQRLGIASVLLRDPDLVILDEPTSGLDPAGQRDVGRLIRRLSEAGKAVLFSSHQIAEVERNCSRIIILKGGRLAFEGRLDQFKTESSVVKVRLSDPGAARDVLQAEPWVRTVSLQEDQQLLVDIGDQAEERVTAALAAADHFVTELRRVDFDMEQLYLDVTGQMEDVA